MQPEWDASSGTSRRVIAEALYRAAHKFFAIFWARVQYMVFKEVHLEKRLRADVFAINWREEVNLIEIKSCRADFQSDNKWQNYVGYANRFFFMCPVGAINPEDIPSGIGLIWVYGPLEDPKFTVKVPADYKKALKITDKWYRWLYRKLAFRKTFKVGNKFISLEDDFFFDNITKG